MELAIVFVSTLLLCHCQAISISSGDEGRGLGISQKDWDDESFKSLFKDESAFVKFRNHYQKGLLRKDGVFNMREPTTGEETIALVDFLMAIKDRMTFFSVYTSLEQVMSREQLLYAGIIALANTYRFSSEYAGIPNLPTWQEDFPNYFVPESVVQQVKTSIEQGTYNKASSPILVPEETDWATYMTEDVALNSLYYNWHLMFPTWADPNKFPTKSKNRGEVYHDFHNQLISNYNLKIANYEMLTRPFNSILYWDDEYIKPGYKSGLLDFNGRPIISRSPKTAMPKNQFLEELKEIETKFQEMGTSYVYNVFVNDTYFFPLSDHPEMISEVLSNLIFNTTESLHPEYYKSYYETAVNYLSSIGSDPTKDVGGAVSYPLTALRDPAYYAALANVFLPIKAIQYVSDRYTLQDLSVEAVTLDSLEVGRLETFFEIEEIDLYEIIDKPDKRKMYYTVEKLRLNHKPFWMKIKLTNYGTQVRQGVITLVLKWGEMIEFYTPSSVDFHQIMDRFKVEIKPGENLFERNFNESLIFTDEDDPNMLRCGIPRRLALPKGRPEGLNMTMFAFVSPFDESKQSEDGEDNGEDILVSPLCGNTKLNYGLPFGFPLDKSIPSETKYVNTLTPIYHEVNKFRENISM